MNGELFDLPPSQPDALAKARLDYERALAEMELLHGQAVHYHGLAAEAAAQVDAARKNVEKARLQLEHAERWAARKA